MKNIFLYILLFLSFNSINGQKNTNNVNKGEQLMLKAFTMYQVGKIDSSIYTYEQAALELGKQDNKTLLIETYANLFAINHFIDNHKAANDAMVKTEALFLEHFSRENESYSDVANSIGAFYKSKGDYDTALKYYKKALTGTISFSLKGSLLNNIAGILALKGDNSEAIKMCKTGINSLYPLSKKTEQTLPILYRDLADYYKNLNELDSTKYYLLKSRYLINEIGFANKIMLKRVQIYNLTALTKMSIEEDKLPLAKKYIQEWEKIYSENYSVRLYQLYINKAKYFEKKNKKEEALLLLNKSKELTKERYSFYKTHTVLGKPYKAAALFYKNSQQYEKALNEVQIGLLLITIKGSLK